MTGAIVLDSALMHNHHFKLT